jgi:4TM region of DNA translocase FtsK/SpoIIIE
MEKGSRLSREIWAVVLVSLAALLILSLVSYHPSDRPPYGAAGSIKELYGFVGYHLANFLRQGIGLSAFLLPVFLLLVAYQLFHQVPELTPLRIASYAVFVLLIVPMLLSVLLEPDEVWDGGGVVGGFLEGAVLMPLFGRIGAHVVSLSLFLLGFILFWRVPLTDMISGLIWREITASASNIEGQTACPELAQTDPGSIKAPAIEKSRKPVQQRFDFMEKDPN